MQPGPEQPRGAAKVGKYRAVQVCSLDGRAQSSTRALGSTPSLFREADGMQRLNRCRASVNHISRCRHPPLNSQATVSIAPSHSGRPVALSSMAWVSM